MKRSVSRGAVVPVVLVAVLLAFPSAGLAQTPASALIAAARAQLDDLNPDSAGKLLLRALDPRAGASTQERVRAFVLYGIAQLSGGHRDAAQATFREALALDPALRVDSLADLHSELMAVFTPLRRQETPPPRPSRGVLEIRGVPANGRLAVDDQPWPQPRREVAPGLRRVLVTAPGYAAYRDSVTVDSGATLVLDVRLRLLPVAADTARVAVPAAPSARPAITTIPSPAARRPSGAGPEVVAEAQVWRIDNVVSSVLVASGIANNAGSLMLGIGARGALNVIRHVRVGAEVSFASGNGATLIAPGVLLVLSPAASRLGPYFLIGTGIMRFSGNGNRISSTFGVNVGAGVNVSFGRSIAFVTEARLRRDSFDEAFGLISYGGTLTVGLSLGRRGRR
jgi:hypothetical protein